MDLLRFMVMPSVFLFLIPLYVVKVEAEDDASIRLELAKRIDDQNLFGYWSSAGTWGSAFCNEPRTASCALTLEIQSPYLGCWCANEVPVLSKVSCIDRSLILVAGLTKAFINTPWTLCSTALIYENVGDEMPEYIAVECFIQLGITYYRNLPTSQLSSKSLGSTTNSITAATAATTATTLKVLSITADTAATTTITSGVLSILTITSYVPSYIYAIPSQSSSLSSTSQPQAADATNHNEVGLGVGLGLGFSAIALGALAWLFYVLKRRRLTGTGPVILPIREENILGPPPPYDPAKGKAPSHRGQELMEMTRGIVKSMDIEKHSVKNGKMEGKDAAAVDDCAAPKTIYENF